MTLYPLKNFSFNSDFSLEINLENIVMFHKYQLLKAYVIIKPTTIDKHNNLIDATSNVIGTFKQDVNSFPNINDDLELKWEWIGRIRHEESIVLEKSAFIIGKLSLP